VNVWLEIGQIFGEQELILCLAGRARGDTEEVGELAIAGPTTAFGDIGWYR
jgi:hypothetical protein